MDSRVRGNDKIGAYAGLIFSVCSVISVVEVR
jgi:hypothetical protein